MLVSGKAQLFDLLGQATTIHPCVSSKGGRDRQGVGWRRLTNRAHMPQRPCSVTSECPLVEGHVIFRASVFQSDSSNL